MNSEFLPAVVLESKKEIECKIPNLVIEIKFPQDAPKAALNLREIKQMAKDWEDLRKQITRPLDDRKKQVMEVFKPVEKLLLDAELKLKAIILAHENERARLRLEELKKREAAAKEAEEKAKAILEAEKEKAIENWDFSEAEQIEVQKQTLVVPVVIPPEHRAHVGISKRLIWKYRIVDFSILPDEFKLENSIKLNEVIKRYKESTTIPGVEVYSEEILAARGF